ncbi:unnamed protein product [Nezara viridula]|uniref:Uncharacterized protein n=1 Tax=Nezara viridula TaxID=85310 RepID=A0A9P0H5Y4_NEZVI|nr:unnamed protein product [Nezara viridula]
MSEVQSEVIPYYSDSLLLYLDDEKIEEIKKNFNKQSCNNNQKYEEESVASSEPRSREDLPVETEEGSLRETSTGAVEQTASESHSSTRSKRKRKVSKRRRDVFYPPLIYF